MPTDKSLLVDVHAHICDGAFDEDRPQVLERALTAGVGAVIAVGENIQDARRNQELSCAFTMIKPGAGLYPTHLDLDAADQMVTFIRNHREDLVAIGEVGLDYWAVKEEDDRAVQRIIFKQFIALSNELDLPLNIHSRSAGRHAVGMLLESQARRVHLHAFDGKASAALPAVEAGYYFSIPPSVIRSRQKQKLVKQLPLENLLVESDSPVLGPDPGQRNNPANLILALQAIAEIKGVAQEQVWHTVIENTERLYGRLIH